MLCHRIRYTEGRLLGFSYDFGVTRNSSSNADAMVLASVCLRGITRNMGQDGDGHAHFDQIWRPNITINYMGVNQNVKF